MLYGGIEAGGTKFVCAVGNQHGDIIERISVETTTPKETMEEVISFFGKFDIASIGIGSFGPIDVNEESSTYGSITTTPKLAWRGYPFVAAMKEAFHVPVGFNTDVNVAALGEVTYGAAAGLDSCLYITIGTGIGAGAVVRGELLKGLSHPEMGHILVRRHPQDTYVGNCPYHKDCLEGLAAGPAIKARWGKRGMDLQNQQEVWEIEGYYIAQALMQYILVLSPKKIIIGGGVMKQKQLFPIIYRHVTKLINHYVELPAGSEYIVSPKLGDNSGIIGSLILAHQMHTESH
ncbi:ROK family protein [Bacillus sp. JJ722]|uniref:ROK family protein n=1 Tax=Bacillus sp. JJ722 TaxID=3122973 RepID=UPI002FFDC707